MSAQKSTISMESFIQWVSAVRSRLRGVWVPERTAVFELKKSSCFFLEKIRMLMSVVSNHVFSPTSGWIDHFSILGEGTFVMLSLPQAAINFTVFLGSKLSREWYTATPLPHHSRKNFLHPHLEFHVKTKHEQKLFHPCHHGNFSLSGSFFLKRFSAWRNPRNQSRSSFWETAARCHESTETEIAKTSDYETMGGTWLWQASSATRWTRVTWRLCYTQFFWSQSDAHSNILI